MVLVIIEASIFYYDVVLRGLVEKIYDFRIWGTALGNDRGNESSDLTCR